MNDEQQRTWLCELQPIVAAWTATLLIVFAGLKLTAIVWFLSHSVNPFADYPLWKAPLLVASDFLAAGALGAVMGVLNCLRLTRRRLARLASGFMFLIALSVVFATAVNLKVIEIYRTALDRYLIHKMSDPSVMSASLFANIDGNLLLALMAAGLFVGLAPRWLCSRWHRSLTGAAPVFFVLMGLGSLVPMAVAYPALRQRDTLGLKHNAILALILPGPGAFMYANPEQTYARLHSRYPDGTSALSLGQSIMHVPAVAGHPELRAAGKGFNVVIILLESISAQYVDAETAPTLDRVMGDSIAYRHHHTTAVNTFDAHYSLFRSMPVRGDAFVMRELHGGFARDISIMEVFHDAGYAVGMFHGSFLSFIDTRWVWEAPGVEKLLDAQGVVSSQRPGWSWGAKDVDLADEAIAWSHDQRDKPTLLIFNPSATHHPYFSESPAHFPGMDCLSHYKSSLYSVDRAVEHLLSGLAKDWSQERTIVIGVSDHGELINTKTNTCGHGMSLIEDELNVPFFIQIPGLTKGRIEELPTDHLDVAPTLISLAGLQRPSQWLGRDLLAETLQPRPTFVGVDYVNHAAVVVGDVIGDLDVANDRVTWMPLGQRQTALTTNEPDPEARRQYEGLLRSYDDRVILHHAAFALARKPSPPVQARQ